MMRVYILGTTLLAAIIGGYFVVQQIKTIGRQEVEIEKLEQNLEVRGRIDAAIRNTPRDLDGALGVLDDFLSTRD